MSEKRLSALAVLSVGKNLLKSSSNFNEKVIEAFVLCKDRRMDLTYKYTVGKGFLQFKFALLCLYSYVLQNYCQLFSTYTTLPIPILASCCCILLLMSLLVLDFPVLRWSHLAVHGGPLVHVAKYIPAHTHTPTVSYNTLL
jgi:hypothetical protein